jgi:histidine triad (HIT) family protein
MLTSGPLLEHPATAVASSPLATLVGMPTLFTRIIEGEIPGVFVWRDPECVAFLSINPMHPGHTLVVPREEVDHWIDLEPTLAAHLFQVAQTIGRAQDAALSPRRIGVMIVGDEVPHVHLHVVPFDSVAELSFAHADPNPRPGSLDRAAAQIREALRDLGAEHVSE